LIAEGWSGNCRYSRSDRDLDRLRVHERFMEAFRADHGQTVRLPDCRLGQFTYGFIFSQKQSSGVHSGGQALN
jgi:hypothetical protein